MDLYLNHYLDMKVYNKSTFRVDKCQEFYCKVGRAGHVPTFSSRSVNVSSNR